MRGVCKKKEKIKFTDIQKGDKTLWISLIFQKKRVTTRQFAPIVLFVCYDKEACWTHPESGESSGSTDATIVSTHMQLEAASIGLGTVWISYFDKEKARELLDIPDNWEINNMIYIGYLAEDFKPNPKMSGKRYPLSHTVWYNEYKKREEEE